MADSAVDEGVFGITHKATEDCQSTVLPCMAKNVRSIYSADVYILLMVSSRRILPTDVAHTAFMQFICVFVEYRFFLIFYFVQLLVENRHLKSKICKQTKMQHINETMSYNVCHCLEMCVIKLSNCSCFLVCHQVCHRAASIANHAFCFKV